MEVLDDPVFYILPTIVAANYVFCYVMKSDLTLIVMRLHHVRDVSSVIE